MVAFRNAGPTPDTDDSVVTKEYLIAGVGAPYDLTAVSFDRNSTRTTGAGDFTFGFKLLRNITIMSVTFRCATADASGNLVAELRANGSQISGTSTSIAAASQVAGGTTTGPWTASAGDILLPWITAVGTTPGKGLIVEIYARVT